MEDRDNKFLSNTIKEKINLENSPVAIKFIVNEKDLPKNMEKIDSKIRHCEMVVEASKGASFYATDDEQLCKGGSSALGLTEAPEKVKSGQMYFGLGRFKSIGSAKRTMDSIPKVDLKSYALAYAPLEEADFDPDIVVIIANPKQAMIISQASIYSLGGRIEADFSGIQSICGDAVAGPFTREKPNVTLGCSGSRSYADLKDEQVIFGLNGENIANLVDGLIAIS